MDQIANGSPQHLLYALQQLQSEVTFLHHHNNNNSNDNSNNNKMDMSIVDRQRLRLQQQNWRSSAQMNGPFVSEIFSDAVMATEWHQFAPQNGHLLTANRQDTPMFSCSMSSPPFPLKNQLSLQNDWPNLSNNVDMVKSGGDGNGAVTETTCLGTFPSDPGFAERAAKFSSFNGNNASGGGSMVTYQKTASVEETAQNTSESVTNVAGNEQLAACSNDSEGSKRICRTVSCPSSVDKTTRDAEKLTTAAEGSVISEKLSPGETKVLSDHPTRKRKNERTRSQDSKAADSDEFKEKRTKSLDKVKEDKKSKTEQSNSDNSVESTPKAVKENSKPSENQQKDYIHVRARRGQATDSHSLAERVRREKISERMKYLQDLVPGCNKVTGKAVMLDEIINYVQSLQRQVEFLSMKLAAVNPRLDLNIDNIFAKEMLAPCGNFSSMGGVSTDLGHYLQFQQMQQQQAALQGVCCGLDMPTVVSSVDATSLHRTPISAEMFVDNNFQGHAPSPWDTELQNVFSTGLVEGRQPPFVSQGISGHMEVNHMKMEL